MPAFRGHHRPVGAVGGEAEPDRRGPAFPGARGREPRSLGASESKRLCGEADVQKLLEELEAEEAPNPLREAEFARLGEVNSGNAGKTETAENGLAAETFRSPPPKPSVARSVVVPIFACSLHVGPTQKGQGSGLSRTAEEVAIKRFHEKMQSASV